MSQTGQSWSQRRQRAMASPERRELLELLTGHGAAPRDAHDLARALGRHVNTVRAHLAVLEEAGLVTSCSEHRQSRGRPRRLYRATAGATSATSDGHAALVEVLAHRLSDTSDDPARDAEQAGRAWGERLAESPLGPDAANGLEAVLALLDAFGFEPSVESSRADEPRVLLGHCPFADVARTHGDVVCSIHLGMLRAFSEQQGSGIEVIALEPFARPDVCVAHLRAASETPA